MNINHAPDSTFGSRTFSVSGIRLPRRLIAPTCRAPKSDEGGSQTQAGLFGFAPSLSIALNRFESLSIALKKMLPRGVRRFTVVRR